MKKYFNGCFFARPGVVVVNGNGIAGSGNNNKQNQVEDDVESFEFAVDENGKPIVDFADTDSGTFTNYAVAF